MAYVDDNLMPNEKVVARASLHWVTFGWSALWLLLALLAFSSSTSAASVGGLLVFAALFAFVLAFIDYRTSEFAVTNKRVIFKTGFIRRSSLELLLSKVEGIQVDQGILGRILGFGSIVVSGTGGSKDPYHRIAAPLEFRRRVQEQVATTQERG